MQGKEAALTLKEQRLGEYQQGSKGSIESHAELKKQKEELEKENEILQSGLLKHQVETDDLHKEMQAKVNQLQVVEEKNDHLKAQVIQCSIHKYYINFCMHMTHVS